MALYLPLRLPQVLRGGVAGEEVNLRHVEAAAEAVQSHTSPAGAQQVARQALDLRQDWLRLLQDLREADETLRSGLDAHSQYLGRRQRLGQDIDRLQLLLQGLGRELEEGGGGPGAVGDEEQLVGRWKRYTVGPRQGAGRRGRRGAAGGPLEEIHGESRAGGGAPFC